MKETFKTCISNGRELYWDGNERSIAFPESLLDFLYWDMETLMINLQRTAAMAQQECAAVETMLSCLTEQNAYFGFLLWSWQHRRPCESGGQWARQLEAMPKKLVRLQRQALELFDYVLNTDLGKQTSEQRLAAYYAVASGCCAKVYQFQPQKLYYEPFDHDIFAEVLYPDSIYDLIDYHLKECMRRGVKLRKCKNCGRYFVVSGHGGAEYCDRVFKGGRTCKEIGATRVWTIKQNEDELFREYRREYKKRFARIRTGRITKEQFYAWSEQAREKKEACETGKLPRVEFIEWLKEYEV